MDWAGKSQFSNERTDIVRCHGKNEMKLIKLAFICQFLHGASKERKTIRRGDNKIEGTSQRISPNVKKMFVYAGAKFPFGK